MEDIFKPQSLTIKELFGNADSFYQIPRYQRPYSWGDDQIIKLWEDLREAQESDPNYFLGSVITAKSPESTNYLDIVDGQQRLTSILILLCVFRDLFPNINQDQLNEDPFSIDFNTIKASIKFNDRLERIRLKTHSNHESDFQDLILKEGNTIINRKPHKYELQMGENPRHKFKNTSHYFTQRLEEIGEDEAGKFLNYLFNKVKIIRIDCQSPSFAIKLFQVLNDRGLDLSNSDLIKSFLIGKINKNYVNDKEILKQKEDQFMDDWKVCENIALDTDESINDLFVLYEYYLLAENPKKALYDELEKLFDPLDPNDIIADFKRFIKRYQNEVYNCKDPVIYSLWYIRWNMYWRSIILTALHTNYPEYQEFISVFRRFYYINWIAGNTLSKIKQTSFNLIKWIKEKRPVAQIKAELEANLHEGSNNAIERAINSLNGYIYYEQWCKPLFFMIEYNQEDNPKYLPIDRTIHMEHIMPQGYKKNVDWIFNDFDGVEDWIHSGANLTLLSGMKNIAASNDKFSNKIEAYDGTGLHDKSDTKITSFRITQKIVNDYKSGKYDKEWNIDSMINRWEWFCDEVEILLNIDLSEIKSNLPHVEL